NFQQLEKILIKNREMLLADAQLNYYFNGIRSNLKLKLDYSKTGYKNRVNNSDLRQITSENYSYGFELRSSFIGLFNYNIGAKRTTNRIKTKIMNSYTDTNGFLDLYFTFNDRFNAKIKSDFYHFGRLEKNKD